MTNPVLVEIQLSRGQVALVDLESWGLVSRHKWYAKWMPSVSGFYAATNIRNADGSRGTLLMHRLLSEAQPGVDVDHVNHITLDNRRCNLRVCSRSQNCANQKKRKHNSTGFKGVSIKKKSGRYSASIFHSGRGLHLGYFSTAEEAARAYDKAARELHGEFARLNFPEAERG